MAPSLSRQQRPSAESAGDRFHNRIARLIDVGCRINRRVFLASSIAAALPARTEGDPASSTWRGNLLRNGVYDGGIRRLNGLRWARAIGGRGFPPPAVAAGVVCVGRNLDANLLAVDADTGRTLWDLSTGHVASTPTIETGVAYLSCEALQREGGLFLAVDLKSGRMRWQVSSDSPENLPPAVVDDTVYFVSTSLAAMAFDRRNGGLRWRHQFAGSSPYTSGFTAPAVHGNVLYLGGAGRMHNGRDGSFLFALDRFSGRELWRVAPRPSPSSVRSDILEHTPVISNNAVLCVSREMLYCFDAFGRGLRWRWQSTDGPITAPAVHEGVAYVGSLRHLLAVDIGTGRVLWQLATGGRVSTPPSIAARAVCFSVLHNNPAHLVAVDIDSRDELWRFTSIQTSGASRAASFSSPVFAGDTIFVTSGSELYSIG